MSLLQEKQNQGQAWLSASRLAPPSRGCQRRGTALIQGMNMFVTLKDYELAPFTRAVDIYHTKTQISLDSQPFLQIFPFTSLPSLNHACSEDTVSPADLPSVPLLVSKENTAQHQGWGRVLLVPECHFQSHSFPNLANSDTQGTQLYPYQLTF